MSMHLWEAHDTFVLTDGMRSLVCLLDTEFPILFATVVPDVPLLSSSWYLVLSFSNYLELVLSETKFQQLSLLQCLPIHSFQSHHNDQDTTLSILTEMLFLWSSWRCFQISWITLVVQYATLLWKASWARVSYSNVEVEVFSCKSHEIVIPEPRNKNSIEKSTTPLLRYPKQL